MNMNSRDLGAAGEPAEECEPHAFEHPLVKGVVDGT